MTKRRTTADDADAALFEAAMRDVVRHEKPPVADRPAEQAPQRPAKLKKARKSAVSPPPKPPAAAAEPATGLPAGIDKRTALRFRRGQMAVDGRLDLHGHTQDDAHRALHAFVRGAYDRGARCILVITGKGAPRGREEPDFMPDRDAGVLRRNVPRWLKETPVGHMVLGIETARPQHGGTGAYYVLLRRKR